MRSPQNALDVGSLTETSPQPWCNVGMCVDPIEPISSTDRCSNDVPVYVPAIPQPDQLAIALNIARNATAFIPAPMMQMQFRPPIRRNKA